MTKPIPGWPIPATPPNPYTEDSRGEHARVLLSATANLHVDEGERDKLRAITAPDFGVVVGYFVPEPEYQDLISKAEKWDAHRCRDKYNELMINAFKLGGGL